MSKRTRLEKDNAGPCPIMRACGGCAWLGVPYKKQLKRKQAAMEELFRPLLDRFGWDVEIDPIRGMGGTSATEGKLASPRAFRYKATTPFAPLPNGRIACGFYAAGTHRIVPAADCAVEAPGARRILNEVARVAESLGMRAYDEDTHRGLLRHAVVRLGWRTDEGVLTVVTTNRDLPREQEFARELLALSPRITCVAQNVNPRPGNAILGPETRVLVGEPCMHDELLGCTFAISPTSFYQTNPQQTEVLYQLAIEGMALRPNDILVDAYCGSGTIGLCAAHATAQSGTPVHLLGIEQNESGVADARLNARLNGLTPEQATFVAAERHRLPAESRRRGRALRRGGARPAARRLHARLPRSRDGHGAAAHRLHQLQPRDAGARPRGARNGRLPAAAPHARGHVPAHGARRDRRRPRPRVMGWLGTCSFQPFFAPDSQSERNERFIRGCPSSRENGNPFTCDFVDA